jgi:cytoskeletal protein RodZ
MSDHDLEKLLGGFAADTLTPEEKQRLYRAALQDQQLFNAIADEQALKELLTDPDVRRRLLQALNQTSASGAGSSVSWLDWFRRPAGLAWAGGLAAATLAVVLGTKVYQDSLKQTDQSVATEETRTSGQPAPPAAQPASPPVAEPQSAGKLAQAPARTATKKEAPLDRLAKGARAASPTAQERNTLEAATDDGKNHPEPGNMRQYADSPAGESDKGAMGSATSAPLDSTPASVQPPAGKPASPDTAPTISARSLYYGKPAAQPGAGLIEQEKKQAMKSLLESSPQANRPDGEFDRFSDLSRAKEAAAGAKPLGLRYSFVVRESNGQEREVDVNTAATSMEPVRLTLETNQDAYLQIWKAVGDAPLQLQLPDKDSPHHSITIVAGQRQVIPWSPEHGPVSLFVRLSRVLQKPLAKQETLSRDPHNLDRLQTSKTVRESIAGEEQATYAVNLDRFSDQLIVNILTRP